MKHARSRGTSAQATRKKLKTKASLSIRHVYGQGQGEMRRHHTSRITAHQALPLFGALFFFDRRCDNWQNALSLAPGRRLITKESPWATISSPFP